jgi:hypothetical protein
VSVAQAAGAERHKGEPIATRYHRSRFHELRAALVGQPRHELDHASGGGGRHPGADFMCRAVGAFGLLAERLAIEHDPEK